jgi:hypothetical protein
MEIEYIKRVVETISGEKIGVKNRKQNLVFLRWIYFYLGKQYTLASHDKIGSLVNRDHASVTHGLANRKGLSNIEMLLRTDERYNSVYNKCLSKIIYKIKDDSFREMSTEDASETHFLHMSDLSLEIIKIKKERKNLLEEVEKLKKMREDPELSILSGLDFDIMKEFKQTRLIPFLRMKKLYI